MKREWSLLVGLPIILLIISLWSSGVMAEKITLTFMSHTYKPWNDALQAQIQRYQKLNPNVEIIYSTVTHADLNMKLMSSLAGGTAPDIMGVYGPWMYELVKNGWLDPAPPFVEEDIKNNTVPIAGQSAEYNGKIYGYIQHIGIPTPVINLDLYEQAGVAEPKTYDELLEINKKLDKVDTKGRLVQAGTALAPTKGGSWNVIHWSTVLKAFGGEIINKEATKSTFNTREGIEATKVYAALTHLDFAPSPSDMWILGKVGMVWTGPWSRSFWKENNPKLRFKAILPLRGPARQATSMYAWFWVVNARSDPKKKLEAWKFLKFISNDENYLELANKVGFISFRKENLTNKQYVSDPWIAAFGEALNFAEVYYARNIATWEKIDMAIGQELERLNAKELTASSTLENAERLVNQILKGGR